MVGPRRPDMTRVVDVRGNLRDGLVQVGDRLLAEGDLEGLTVVWRALRGDLRSLMRAVDLWPGRGPELAVREWYGDWERIAVSPAELRWLVRRSAAQGTFGRMLNWNGRAVFVQTTESGWV